jgi:hypothetical protein
MTPRRQAATRAATRADAVAFLAKSREFLRAAQDSLSLEHQVAATGNAVHAGIAAADAIAAARLGSVWVGEHTQAAGHLEQAGTDGGKAAALLRRLVPLKNRAEYDPRPVPVSEAKSAVKAVERLLAIAERVVNRGGS